MRRRNLLGIAALLSVLLIVLLAARSGLVDNVRLLLLGNPGTFSSSTTVFVDPKNTVNEALQSGSKFTVHVNVSGVTSLFAWQINVTWTPNILDVSNIIPGELQDLTPSVNKTSSAPRYFGGVGYVINATKNADSSCLMAESILEDTVPGNHGVNGSARLVSIEFTVKGYGSADIVINNSAGNFRTTLLNTTGGTIAYTKTDGYFRNKIPGDVDGDSGHDVDRFDFGLFATAYGSTAGPPPSGNWNREADFEPDGDVDRFDFGTFAANYGRSI